MQDEGKDGESEEDSNKIVYDDKMIADMLDRNKVAEEEKAVAYNDYLQVMSHLLLSVASSMSQRKPIPCQSVASLQSVVPLLSVA